MNRPIPTDDELARYLADELSATDRARVDAWAAADAVNRAELERLRAAWQSPAPSARWNVDGAWSRVDAQLDTGASVTPIRTAQAWHQQAGWRAAAALLLVAGLGYWWRPFSTEPLPSEQQFATAVGEVRDVLLADSTRVTLGPSSTLRVLADYGQKERMVVLVGEAEFTVRHDASHPFSVRAAHSITRDIGTVFTIRALEGDTLVRVTVQEGIASLRHVDGPVDRAVTLKAHDVGVLAVNSREVRTATDPAATAAWREGQLTFDSSSLSDVVVELRRWYRVTVAPLDSTLATRRVSATLPSRDLTEALEILRLAMGIDIVQRGDTLTFR